MELWDAYDRDGNKLEETLVRGEAVPEGRYHLVASVLVRHQDGEYLLMKRDERKETWPDVYEASAGGSVVKGETALQAVKRELAEETGICDGVFTHLCRRVNDTNRAIYECFLCETNHPKEAITLQAGETTGFLWTSGENVLQMMNVQPHIIVIHPWVEAYIQGQR